MNNIKCKKELQPHTLGCPLFKHFDARVSSVSMQHLIKYSNTVVS